MKAGLQDKPPVTHTLIRWCQRPPCKVPSAHRCRNTITHTPVTQPLEAVWVWASRTPLLLPRSHSISNALCVWEHEHCECYEWTVVLKSDGWHHAKKISLSSSDVTFKNTIIIIILPIHSQDESEKRLSFLTQLLGFVYRLWSAEYGWVRLEHSLRYVGHRGRPRPTQWATTSPPEPQTPQIISNRS